MVLTHNMMKEEDTIRQEAIKITNKILKQDFKAVIKMLGRENVSCEILHLFDKQC